MESRLVAAMLIFLAVGCSKPVERATASAVVDSQRLTATAPQRPSARPSVAYPALIQKKADSAGLKIEVVNRGNSGVTSAGTLATIDWILQDPPAVLVIETGANDGLRGQDPDSTRATIQMIIDRVRARDSSTRIALVGMEAMPNLGRRYVEQFRAIYPELARANRLVFVPFLLAGVAGVDSLNQGDGIHPNPRGHQIVAETVWRVIRPTLEAAVRRP